MDISPDGLTAAQQFAEIRSRIRRMITAQMECCREDIQPRLADKGISLLSHEQLSADERLGLAEFFCNEVYPVLTPEAVDPSHPFPYISGGSLNIGLFASPKLNKRVARALANNGKDIFVRIKVPQFLPRFVPVPDRSQTYVLIEDIIAANIDSIVPGSSPESCHTFRITRDADIEVKESDIDDLLEMMEQNLKQRRFGSVVRLEIARSMPPEMADYLKESLGVEREDLFVIDGPLKLIDLGEIAGLNRPDLKDAPLRVRTPEAFQRDESLFDTIKRGDVLLHHPYMPYTIVTDLIAEAAEDPDVLAIKMCLYRLGAESPIPQALIRACELGKQVTVLIELKARFDEGNNIEWARRLEEAGVHVIYGLLGLKTHSKTTLIVRREDDRLRRYVHAATGNYNPETSAAYTDLGLLTCDDAIGEDATELFNFLTVYAERGELKKLLMAPVNLRVRLLEMIERETENARRGVPARIVAKLNRLADSEIVNALYSASQAGVSIDLVVRGICTLRPGIPGISENIRVRSIVGRLLEHSRVYYFENAGDYEIYIGSSDLMPRNLDRRVEVLTPIDDPGIRRFLRDEYLADYLRDNTKSHELLADGSYRKIAAGEEPAFSAQEQFQFSAFTGSDHRDIDTDRKRGR
jgi:polyphosphate kinase